MEVNATLWRTIIEHNTASGHRLPLSHPNVVKSDIDEFLCKNVVEIALTHLPHSLLYTSETRPQYTYLVWCGLVSPASPWIQFFAPTRGRLDDDYSKGAVENIGGLRLQQEEFYVLRGCIMYGANLAETRSAVRSSRRKREAGCYKALMITVHPHKSERPWIVSLANRKQPASLPALLNLQSH